MEYSKRGIQNDILIPQTSSPGPTFALWATQSQVHNARDTWGLRRYGIHIMTEICAACVAYHPLGEESSLFLMLL